MLPSYTFQHVMHHVNPHVGRVVLKGVMNVQQDGYRLKKKDVKVLLYVTITRIVTGFRKNL